MIESLSTFHDILIPKEIAAGTGRVITSVELLMIVVTKFTMGYEVADCEVQELWEL